MQPTKISRVVCVNDSSLLSAPIQLLLIRKLQKPRFATRRDVQPAMAERIQQGMAVGILVEMNLDGTQAADVGVRSRSRQAWRSSSKYPSISSRWR